VVEPVDAGRHDRFRWPRQAGLCLEQVGLFPDAVAGCAKWAFTPLRLAQRYGERHVTVEPPDAIWAGDQGTLFEDTRSILSPRALAVAGRRRMCCSGCGLQGAHSGGGGLRAPT